MVLYWAGSGVKSVAVVLEVFRESWFCCVQLCICCKYCCTCVCAVVMLVWVERMVMSSAYVMVFTVGYEFDDGVGYVGVVEFVD